MHEALFYSGDQQYLDGLRRFIEPALAAGEPVAVAVPPAKGALLRERLNGAGERIELLDMAELGRNPARIIPAVEQLSVRHDGRLLHYVGEPIWPGRSDEEVREATKHEALINFAWEDAPIRVLCPYDVAVLDEQVLADAERTHPCVIRNGETLSSSAYTRAVPAICDERLARPPTSAQTIEFGLGGLRGARAAVAEQARAAGLSKDRAADLVLAVNELAVNAVRHGHGGGVLRVWTRPDAVVCQVEDRGHITDPLAGRHVPSPDLAGGVGLWMVNQICDLVEVRTGASGTTVRAQAQLN